ncbi:HEAT repeat-containing protein 6 isoform X2 [Oryzias latipes]
MSQSEETTSGLRDMAAPTGESEPASPRRAFPSMSLSAEAAPFVPESQLSCLSEAEKHFSRCSAKLRALRADSVQLREQLNLLFDQLLSENYNKTLDASVNIRPEDVCSLLKHTSCLVPLSQEHLVVKFCQLVHHLLNQLKVIMDEQTLNVLLNYTVTALKDCSAWTHSDVVLALSTVVYGNGPHCQQVSCLLSEGGLLLQYSSLSQQSMELRHVALNCMANICLRNPGQPPLDEQYRNTCFQVFLKTLLSLKPPDTDEHFYCVVIQAALKGVQYCLSGGKWKFGGGDELGSLLAALKRLMFQGTPGLSMEWPAVLYPAPLPQYEGVPSPKPAEPQAPSAPPKNATAPGKTSGNKKRKSKGKDKKTQPEESRGEEKDEEDKESVPALQRGEEGRGSGGTAPKPFPPLFYPSWKLTSSDSEFSDTEGNVQSKLRLSHVRVRQGALHCILAVVKAVENRTLYGYWSSFIPDSPTGGPPPLTLLTIILKDPSPKVRLCALQVLTAMLDGSRQFLAVAEDTAPPRTSYTPFSFLLATSVRELHRALSLALLAETSSQTLTQVIKCLSFLVANAPYHRLRHGLLTSLWKQIRPYVRHRDVTVRVSALTLYGAVVTTQAPLPEVQLLLQQPDDGSSLQDSALSWRQRNGEVQTSAASSKQSSCTQSPQSPCTPVEKGGSPPWLLKLCLSLVTQPREDHFDSEGGDTLEPLPVRLAALQVLSHLVRGYFSLTQASLSEIGQASTHCLGETDPPLQLHGSKLLEECGTGIILQYRAENNLPESSRVSLTQVVQFWSSVLSGPLTAALQNEQHSTLQASACDTLASILPQAFAQLPDKTQLMCITMLLGLTYLESSLVKMAAVRALGLYIRFPCLREDVMFVADTANIVLAALDDRSINVRARAAWSLGNLTDTLVANMQSVGADFQEEFSDMLLLKMLQAATRASADKDRVKSSAVRALGNLLRFLRESQMIRSAFQRPLEEALVALVKTVQSEATMKVRWNACYALGNAFRNPALPLKSAAWTHDAFSALCHAVTSCKNFKVRIESAAALAVPTHRDCYRDTKQFMCVWHSLVTALEHSEDTNDFLEYRYSASLRHKLSQALLHLLSLSQWQDMPSLGKSLAGDEGSGVKKHLTKFFSLEQTEEETDQERDSKGESFPPQQRIKSLQETLKRLKELNSNGVGLEELEGKETVANFLEELLKTCEVS